MQKRFSLGQGRITKGAFYLLIASAALSLVFMMSGDELKVEMASWLIASGDSVFREYRFWQLVTSPVLEHEFVSLLFHGFMLWMFLPVLERWWGTKKFLLFALYTSVAGAFAGSLVGLWVSPFVPLSGFDPFIFGGMVAYGVLFADRNIQFFGVLPLTGKQLTIGIVAFVALFIILGERWAEGAANAAAMLLAWAMTSGKFSPKLWYLKGKQKRLRRHLKIVKGDDKPKRWVN